MGWKKKFCRGFLFFILTLLSKTHIRYVNRYFFSVTRIKIKEGFKAKYTNNVVIKGKYTNKEIFTTVHKLRRKVHNSLLHIPNLPFNVANLVTREFIFCIQFTHEVAFWLQSRNWWFSHWQRWVVSLEWAQIMQYHRWFICIQIIY